jgi:hypothetical protein
MYTFEDFVYENTNDGWKVSAWCEQEEVPIETEIKWYTFLHYIRDWFELSNSEAMKLYFNMEIDQEIMFLEMLFINRFNAKNPRMSEDFD